MEKWSTLNVCLLLGKTRQSNSIQRARVLLKEISKAPDRTLIVVDPRRTESAELADIHLAVKLVEMPEALSADDRSRDSTEPDTDGMAKRTCRGSGPRHKQI